MTKATAAQKLERRPIAAIKPSSRNPRTHDEAQIAKLAESIRQFGFCAPILVDASGEIVAGHGRLEAAKAAGLADVPVIVLGHLTRDQVKAYRIADNRLAEDADWDEQMLGEIMRDLAGASFDVCSIGFSDTELARLLPPPPSAPALEHESESERAAEHIAPLGPAAEAPEQSPMVAPTWRAPSQPGLIDEDEAPVLPTVPTTRLGDIWIMGPHRLICGDASMSTTLAALLDGALPDLLFTDPPYGMSYRGHGARTGPQGVILGDDVRGENLVGAIGSVLTLAVQALRVGAAAYICLTWRTYREFQAALEAAGLPITACIVWDKGSIGPGTLHYRPQHEFIFYSRGDQWHGLASEADIWRYSRAIVRDYVHPTQKPVWLVERAIWNSTRPGEMVLDVFAGSGTTVIAAERLGRRASMAELDPKYCDAIVRRWEAYTGRKAERIAAQPEPAAAE